MKPKTPPNQFFEQFWSNVFPTPNLHRFLMCFSRFFADFFKARPLRNTAWAHEFRRSAFSKKIPNISEKSSQNSPQVEPKSSQNRSQIEKNRFKTQLRTQMRPKTTQERPREPQERPRGLQGPQEGIKPDLAGEWKAHLSTKAREQLCCV